MSNTPFLFIGISFILSIRISFIVFTRISFWRITLSAAPPMLLFRSFLLFAELLFQYSAITGMVGDNLINLPPIRQTADTSVVNEPVGFELAGEVIVVLQTLFRIILVYSPEFNSSFSTPLPDTKYEMMKSSKLIVKDKSAPAKIPGLI